MEEIMIIKKNDEFVNENDELVRIVGKHFDDYAVEIFHYNEDTEEYDIYDRSTIYTAHEVRRLANAREITWSEEDDN
jgi:hypothetical protein